MDQRCSPEAIAALIGPIHPKGEGGRPAYRWKPCMRVQSDARTGLATSDPAIGRALYETTICGILRVAARSSIPRRNHHPQLPVSLLKRPRQSTRCVRGGEPLPGVETWANAPQGP